MYRRFENYQAQLCQVNGKGSVEKPSVMLCSKLPPFLPEEYVSQFRRGQNAILVFSLFHLPPDNCRFSEKYTYMTYSKSLVRTYTDPHIHVRYKKNASVCMIAIIKKHVQVKGKDVGGRF